MDSKGRTVYDSVAMSQRPREDQEEGGRVDTWMIRPGTLEELDALIRLRRSLFEAMGYTDPTVLARTDDACRAYFTQEMPSGSFRVWVAEAQDRLVASIGLVVHSVPPSPGNPTGKVGYIMNLVTDAAYRRKGIARALMQWVMSVLDSEGVPIASLHATPDGRPLYKSLGFAADEHTPEMRARLNPSA